MGFVRIGLLVGIMLASSVLSKAQDAADLLTSSDSTFTSSDSLSIFRLLDSLIQLQDAVGSQLAVRLAYNSNVLSAGRTLGIDQFGLAPGLSYYHKSGLFADVSSYWSNDFEPNYYLTILSVGYMHLLSKKLSVIAGYDRYFYNFGDDAFISYKNTLSLSPYMDFKHASFRADYAFFFGDQTAHRITPSVNLKLTKRNFLGIEKIRFNPGAQILFGNETFTNIEIRFPETLMEAVQNYRKYGTYYKIVAIEKKVFGTMNYAISAPVIVSHKNWNFTFTYVYNIPKALPGETLTLKESAYLAASITYFIDLKRKSGL
jgi:hypothetical protein